MLVEMKRREFANGVVYALQTPDSFPVEVTDTFLPYYTKDAIGRNQNYLDNYELGSRDERWMIGVSCMSGCPVRCKFCATGQLKRYRNLTADEIIEQVMFILDKHGIEQAKRAKEFKINYTRMGEPFLNIVEVRKAIDRLDKAFATEGITIHHYISTIGIKGADYSWIKGNKTLQVSLHSLDDDRRNDLIPYKNKVTIQELGEIRTDSDLKTTVNMTLVDESDFDITKLEKYFDKNYFFIKLSPINVNEISETNNMGAGIIEAKNLR